MSESRCPWKIHWGVGQESTTQCDKDEHLGKPVFRTDEGVPYWRPDSDLKHEGPAGNGVTTIVWLAGDRREYTGDWPGPCPLLERGLGNCTLHMGHHGRCAP